MWKYSWPISSLNNIFKLHRVCKGLWPEIWQSIQTFEWRQSRENLNSLRMKCNCLSDPMIFRPAFDLVVSFTVLLTFLQPVKPVFPVDWYGWTDDTDAGLTSAKSLISYKLSHESNGWCSVSARVSTFKVLIGHVITNPDGPEMNLSLLVLHLKKMLCHIQAEAFWIWFWFDW